MGPLLFRALVRIGVALPLAALVLVAFAWWGARSWRLASQIDRQEPTAMPFSDAVARSRDGDVYARMDDAHLDCAKSLVAPAGVTFAVVDGEGRVAAMARLPSCDESEAEPLI